MVYSSHLHFIVGTNFPLFTLEKKIKVSWYLPGLVVYVKNDNLLFKKKMVLYDVLSAIATPSLGVMLDKTQKNCFA